MKAPGAVAQPVFATTHWSVVLAAAADSNPECTVALENLCCIYWYPLYAFVRHRGYSREDAQDLTQEFFHRLLVKGFLAQVDQRKGKFRSFLLASINHFLANEWDRATALKRGGHLTFVPLDELAAERHYQSQQSSSAPRSPEQLFERCWALALLESVMRQVRQEWFDSNRGEQFDVLKMYLAGDKPSLSYGELAARLNLNEVTLRKQVQRLRQRYAALLRQEITRTITHEAEFQEELSHLYNVLSY